MLLHLLEAEHEAVGGAPAWVFGLIFLVIFLVALMIVRGIGSGRPHA